MYTQSAKTLNAKIERMMQVLENKVTTDDYERTLTFLIKRFKAAFQKKRALENKSLLLEYNLKKRCIICDLPTLDHLMVLCDYCDDGYHCHCLSPPIAMPGEDEQFMCPDCKADIQLVSTEPRQQYCRKCNNKFFDEQPKVRCVHCQYQHHQKCMGSIEESIVCPPCFEHISSSLPGTYQSLTTMFSQQSAAITRLKYCTSEKSFIRCPYRGLKLPEPTTTPQFLIQKMTSLAFALRAKKSKLAPQLVYSKECTPEQNKSALFNVPCLSFEDELTVLLARKLHSRGDYGRITVDMNRRLGFFLRAQQNIQQGTIICQYTGELDTFRNHVFDKSDAIFTLAQRSNSRQTLVICPNQYSGAGRFICGINNMRTKDRQKVNVWALLAGVCGQTTVLMLAARKILKGQILYVDYNGGFLRSYPTGHFQ